MLSPEERAEKIVRGDWTNQIQANQDTSISCEDWRKLESRIAAEIREAIEESKSQSNQMLACLSYDLGVEDGKSKALEEAAKVAELYPTKVGLSESMWATPNVCRIIAEQIRALKSEEKK